MRLLSIALFALILGWGIGVYVGEWYQLRADQWDITSRSVNRTEKGDSLVQR